MIDLCSPGPAGKENVEMANRECNGDFSQPMACATTVAFGTAQRCPPPANGDKCPNCSRMIDGTEAGEWTVRTVRLAISSCGMELRLPEAPNNPDTAQPARDCKTFCRLFAEAQLRESYQAEKCKICKEVAVDARDALAERVRMFEERINKIEAMFQACQQAQEKANGSWVVNEADCPRGDGCCAECNYFEAYVHYLRADHEQADGKAA